MTDRHYDAIIVLGASLNTDASLTDSDKLRLEKVVDLFNSGTSDVIIVCGSHGYKSVEKPTLTEAKAYANYLESLGVEESHIYLEERSQETLGNILFTKMEFLIPHDWRRLLVIPTFNHSSERIEYLLKKIFGNEYDWDLIRIGENTDRSNKNREELALKHTKEINDKFSDGNHEAIYQGLMETHPAYGGKKWTLDELREQMKH